MHFDLASRPPGSREVCEITTIISHDECWCFLSEEKELKAQYDGLLICNMQKREKKRQQYELHGNNSDDLLNYG